MPIFLFRWICTVLMPGERWKEVRAEDFLTCKRHFTSSHITSSTSSKHWWSVFIIQCLMVMVLLCAFVTTMIQLVKQWKILHIKGMWLWGTTSFWKSGTSWSTGDNDNDGLNNETKAILFYPRHETSALRAGRGIIAAWVKFILCTSGYTQHEWTIFHAFLFQDWPESFDTAPVGLCCYACIDRYDTINFISVFGLEVWKDLNRIFLLQFDNITSVLQWSSFITVVNIATVPNWVPFRGPGSPRGPFCGFGYPLGLLFCLKVPFFSILG